MKYLRIICLILLTACDRPKRNNTYDYLIVSNYLTDKSTLRDVVLKSDKQHIKFVFDKRFKPATLSHIDMLKIYGFIDSTIKAYNSKADRPIEQPLKYYKQLVVVMNPKGEKEVWVSCSCEMYGNKWKQEIQNVYDGGRCFFQLKINLTKDFVYDFSVNGIG